MGGKAMLGPRGGGGGGAADHRSQVTEGPRAQDIALLLPVASVVSLKSPDANMVI